jgi:hypothetical protein
MSAIGPSYSMSFIPQGCIGQEGKLIEQLSAISLNQEDPRFHTANRLMAVSFMNKMADSCSAKSLELIAANPNTPIAMLRQLASNETEDVRVAVAENPSTPRDLLMILARDQQADVRYAIAENANLAPEILQLLCEDDNPYVSSRAMRSIVRQKSGRFTESTTRLNVIAARGSKSDRGIKRFINTLTNLAKISAEQAS